MWMNSGSLCLLQISASTRGTSALSANASARSVSPAIHVRLRRGIDQDIELERSQSLPHLFRLPKIELRVIESNDVIIVCVLPRQGRAKTTTGSDNDYTPLRLHR